jgi:hypothetical protein
MYLKVVAGCDAVTAAGVLQGTPGHRELLPHTIVSTAAQRTHRDSSNKHMRYVETFDGGPGGWLGRNIMLEVADGVATSRSPWWIDANHAPHYLHLNFCLMTGGSPRSVAQSEQNAHFSGPNGFIARTPSRDFRDARITLRLRGLDYQARGARFALVVQGATPGMAADHSLNFAYTGEYFDPRPQWSEQTITVDTDPSKWLYLSARQDLAERYRGDSNSVADISELLKHVELNIIFCLIGMDVTPHQATPLPAGADMHRLQPRNSDLPAGEPASEQALPDTPPC